MQSIQTIKKTDMLALGIGLIVIIGLGIWATYSIPSSTLANPLISTSATTTKPTPTPGPTTPGSTGTSGGLINSPTGTPAKVESYGNATYDFIISYPIDLTAGAFGTFHLLNSNDWRIGATAAKRGTPVVAIPVVRIDNQAANKKNYPLYYDAEVRVGVSLDTAQCYATDNGYTNQTVTNVTINGVTFKKFIFGDAAMMQYVNGASYRTIHNNKCYVIEQIRNGSSYRDDTIVGGYSDIDLDAFYAKTTLIVMSFKFTK